MCNRTSCVQVHELPQNHCGDNREDISLLYIDKEYIYILHTHTHTHIYIYIHKQANFDSYIYYIIYILYIFIYYILYI